MISSVFPGEIPGRSRLALLGRRGFPLPGSVTGKADRGLVTKVNLFYNGNVWSGPWSYRIAYLLLITPLYSVTLVAVGTLFGKHAYFKDKVLRMWGRLLPRRMHNLSIGAGEMGRE